MYKFAFNDAIYLSKENKNTKIKYVIEKKAEEGKLIIISSHDKESLCDICDQIIKIQEGRLIEE